METLESLPSQVVELNSASTRRDEQYRALIEKTEDLANRSLRKNIIIRGIKEPKEEVKWEETRAVAAKAIANVTGDTVEHIDSLFERIHRGPKPKKNSDQAKYPRKIFACLYDWKQVDKLQTALREAERNDIYIDQQYGPITTYRRSQAFLKRKTLIKSGTVTAAKVKFPAQLLVKYGRESTFVLSDDFSNIPVPDDIFFK